VWTGETGWVACSMSITDKLHERVSEPYVLEELVPAPWHRTDRYANNRMEADHGRLKARLRPMRGLKQDQSARVVLAGHAFVQNLRRGHYELAIDEPVSLRLAVAFVELAVRLRQASTTGRSPIGRSRTRTVRRPCGVARTPQPPQPITMAVVWTASCHSPPTSSAETSWKPSRSSSLEADALLC
jgi:hypothetical protein